MTKTVVLTRTTVDGDQMRFIVLRIDEAEKAIRRGKMKWGSGPQWTVKELSS